MEHKQRGMQQFSREKQKHFLYFDHLSSQKNKHQH